MNDIAKHTSYEKFSEKIFSDDELLVFIDEINKIRTVDKNQYKTRHFNSNLRKLYLKSFKIFKLILNGLNKSEIRNFIKSNFKAPVIQHIDFLIKEPGGPATLWHQDQVYWHFDNPPSMRTFWFALVDVEPENGALEIYNLTLNNGAPLEHERVEHSPGQTQLYIQKSIQEKINSSRNNIQTISLKKGEALRFDSLVLHAATGNNSNSPRIAFKVVVGEKSSLGGFYLLSICGWKWWLSNISNHATSFLYVKTNHFFKVLMDKIKNNLKNKKQSIV